jgi:3-oxoacyl-[acyl-carrier-protein] synthase-1
MGHEFIPLRLSHFTASTSLGQGKEALWQGLMNYQSALKPCDFDDVRIACWIGEVAGVNELTLPPHLQDYDCRNNRLAVLGLEADCFSPYVRSAIARYGRHRVGVFMGTSTSGILQTELAYRQRDTTTGKLPPDFKYATTHNSYSLARFVRALFGLQGPAHVISSACSSSAKVFVAAEQMIRLGVIDAAIVGGVDSLCLTTLYGFHSLELTSPQACCPYDEARDGLSLGEAAAFAFLERAAAPNLEAAEAPPVFLLGYGESSDAHHMSTPHPEGLGAQMAMKQALTMAKLKPEQIDYLNLHGTATPNNDAAEGKAVEAVFGCQEETNLVCSSTKGSTGHTLGAAGGVEAVICALALQHQTKPAGANTQQLDSSISLHYLLQHQKGRVDYVQSNSFGFGGTNCSLIFGRDVGPSQGGLAHE